MPQTFEDLFLSNRSVPVSEYYSTHSCLRLAGAMELCFYKYDLMKINMGIMNRTAVY